MKLLFSVVCMCLSAGLFLVETASAQGPGIIPVTTSFQRVYAIVPLVGRGTSDDPVRPMFVPAGGLQQNVPSVVERLQPNLQKPRTGILSYTAIPTDDGKHAIVEFVSADRAGLRELLESKAPGVQVFERGRQPQAAIDAIFKARRKDFDFSKFQNKVR